MDTKLTDKTEQSAPQVVAETLQTPAEAEPEAKPVSSKTDVYKVCTIVLGVVVALETIAIVTAAIMMKLNGLKLVATLNGKRVAEIYNVCTDDVIKRWNNIYDFDAHAGQNFNPIPEVKGIVYDIKKRPNYEKDSTCQYFIFQSALYDNDVDTMKKSVQAMYELSKKGSSVSDRVIYRQSLDDMKKLINQFKK